MTFEPAATFVTDVPGRLDRMPWSAFHWRVTIALGITWVLDGLEVTLAGTLAGALARSPALHLDGTEVGLAASAYLSGVGTADKPGLASQEAADLSER